MMFQKQVIQDGILEVIDISEKQENYSRPPGLNTVNLLKVRILGMNKWYLVSFDGHFFLFFPFSLFFNLFVMCVVKLFLCFYDIVRCVFC